LNGEFTTYDITDVISFFQTAILIKLINTNYCVTPDQIFNHFNNTHESYEHLPLGRGQKYIQQIVLASDQGYKDR